MKHRKLALGSFLSVLNLVLTAGASLVVMPFAVRTLGDAQYGVWLIVGAFVGYFGLFDFGLSSAVNRFLAAARGAQDTPRAQAVLGTALTLFSSVGCVVLVGTALLVWQAPALGVRTVPLGVLRQTMAIAGVAFAAAFPLRAISGVLQAQLRYDAVASRDTFALALRTTLVVLALRLGFGLPGMAWASLIATLAPAVALIQLARRAAPDLRFDPRTVQKPVARELFAFSGYAFVAQLADMLRFRLDAVVVARFAGGAAAVTHYGIAATLIQYFISLVTAALSVFGGVFGRQSGAGAVEDARRTFFFALKLAVVLASFAGFGLIAWGGMFIERWMGAAYRDVYPTLVALAVGCTAALWQAPSVPFLYSIKRHQFYAASNIAEGVLNLTCSVLLARQYGVFGVALGTLFPMLLIKLLVQPIYVCRVSGITLRSYVSHMGRCVGLTAVCLIPAAGLTRVFPAHTYPALVALGAVSLVTFLPLAYVLVLKPAEQQAVLALVRQRKVPVAPAPGLG